MSEHLTIESFLSESMNANQRAHLLDCVECQSFQEKLTLMSSELEGLSSAVDFEVNKDMPRLIQSEAKRIRFEVWRRRALQYVLPLAALFIFGLVIFTKEARPPLEADRLAEMKEVKATKVAVKKAAISQFDVIDVFRLAKALENESLTEALEYDLNNNGLLDENDLLQLRTQVVSLGVNQ